MVLPALKTICAKKVYYRRQIQSPYHNPTLNPTRGQATSQLPVPYAENIENNNGNQGVQYHGYELKRQQLCTDSTWW